MGGETSDVNLEASILLRVCSVGVLRVELLTETLDGVIGLIGGILNVVGSLTLVFKPRLGNTGRCTWLSVKDLGDDIGGLL